MNKWDYTQVQSFCIATEIIREKKIKGTLWKEIKCLQTIYLIRDYYPRYIKNSQKSITKEI